MTHAGGGGVESAVCAQASIHIIGFMLPGYIWKELLSAASYLPVYYPRAEEEIVILKSSIG